MLRAIDTVNRILALIAAWLFFIAGWLITYEVVSRYIFNEPTIWGAELAQLLLLWGTFLGMGYLLQKRQHIRITFLFPFMPVHIRRGCEIVSLLLIAALTLSVIYYGYDIALDSFVRGRSTGTMLNIPNWWSEAVIPASFLMLLLQTAAEIIRTLRGDALIDDDHGEG